MLKKFHLIQAALLALVLGTFVILYFRRQDAPSQPRPRSGLATPETSATTPAPASDVRPAAEAGPRLRGRVLSDSRQPIEGARIWIGHGWWNRSKPLGASTNDGSYDLPLPASDMPSYQQIHFMAEGCRPETRRHRMELRGIGEPGGRGSAFRDWRSARWARGSQWSTDAAPWRVRLAADFPSLPQQLKQSGAGRSSGDVV